jgi:hypothetical protein
MASTCPLRYWTRSLDSAVIDPDERRALTSVLRDLGLATTDDTPALALMAGGYRNRVFRWRRDAQLPDGVVPDAVLKVYVDAPENPLFPTLPAHEAASLELLSGYGLAPPLIAFATSTPVGDVLVYEMVPGGTWSAATGAEAVGGLLRRVHGVEVGEVALRSLAVTTEQLVHQTRDVVERIADPAMVARLHGALDRARATDAAPAAAPCLVHTDPGPGNVVVGPDGLRLIDWQCPGLGDPIEDLAAFASPAIQILYGCPPLSAGDVARMLDGYAATTGGHDAVLSAAERFEWRRPMYAVRIAAYCAHRAETLSQDDPEIAERYRSALVAELDELGA